MSQSNAGDTISNSVMAAGLSKTRWRWVGLGLMLALTTCFASAATPKRVLILDSFGRDIAPFNAGASAFRTTLARELGEPVDIYEASLDAARFAEPEKEEPFVAFLKSRFESRQLDLVVPIGAPATRFMAKYRQSLFANTPIVFMATEPRLIPPALLQTNATLVTQRVNVPGLVEDILQLRPDTTNIVVVFGASPLEKFWVNESRREFLAFTNRVGFTWLNDFSLEQMEKRVAMLPPRSFVLFVMLVMDASGVPYDGNAPLQRLHAVANAPSFGYFASQFGSGAIGGRLYQETEVGARAARAAVRILRGERPEGIAPQVLEAASPVYDWRELRRWQIPESRLPAGSEIRFREPTLWEAHRWQIISATALCLGEAALIGLLVINLRKRRRVERSLRETDGRFRLAVEASPNAMILVNREGRIALVNAQVEKVFQYQRAELVGQSIETLVPERFRADHPAHRAGFASHPEARQMGAGRELWGRRRDGSEVPVEIGLNPMHTSEGQFFLASIVDITERKRAEKEARELRNNLAHMGRVDALGALSGSLAHELNQPLGIILSNAEAAQELLGQQPPDVAEAQAILSDIVAADRRAAQVIERLRALLKRGEMSFQSVPLNDVIEEVINLVRADLLARGVVVVRQLADDLPPVKGDRVQLQQLVLNLILNAADAMSNNPSDTRRLHIHTVRQQDKVRASVRDEGVGLPANPEQLFQPFYTTKPKGLGLGLPICRSITDAHGGRLWAEPHPERGAVFHFEIPVNGAPEKS